MVLILGYMLRITWEAFVLRLHPWPGESAASKMGCRLVAFSAPSDSDVYPGWRTGAIEQWFSSHWLHVRNTWGDFKKSKCLGPTPEQMSQNLWKRSLTTLSFPSSFRWSGTPQVLRIIVIGNLVNEKNLDLNPFLALGFASHVCLWGDELLLGGCLGWWKQQRAEKVSRDLKARFRSGFTIVRFAMWCGTSHRTSLGRSTCPPTYDFYHT